ncbi:MAG TPA: FAD-dependent oxidoreductase [Bryobacteraceae bacterium]|nr:FAD-dependent oxidoreductase [Bryobacteraceae bacterium]
MKNSKYLILGGGMVAGYAAKEMAGRGLKAGELTIVSSDNAVPYERPPLSKGFLAGKENEENIRINPVEFYGEHGIDLKLTSDVSGVDGAKKFLALASGQEIGFDKLIVATGAAVNTLEIPGANLSGIHYLRSLEDSKRIRAHADGAKRAAVVGSGFIAMEAASVLAQKGIETTMIVRDDRIWKKIFTPAMSRSFESYFAKHGVRFIKQSEVKEARGQGALASVTLSGQRTIECDLMVVGIGVRPVTEVLAKSGIEVAGGVVVDEYLETHVPGIFAAGDVASYRDTLFGKRRRVEHWDNAVSQGQHCARALMGERTPFVHVPYFFSDVFDLSYELWGDMAEADEVIERGDLASTSFSVWWLKQQRLVAAFTMNRPDEERSAAPRWIESKQRLTAEELRSGKWPTG